MKNLVLTSAFILATATSVTLFAQEKKQAEKKEIKVEKPKDSEKNNQAIKSKTPEQRADAITKRMMKVTGATSDKEAKVKDINLATEKQRDSDVTKFANDKEGLKASRRKRNMAREQNLKEVFSADEYTKWTEHKKEMKAKHKAKKQDAKKTEAVDEVQDAIED